MFTTPASRVSASLVALSLALTVVVAGCAADAHPATEDSSESLTEVPETANGSAALVAPICTPGATRECKRFWHDNNQRLHCVLEAQTCRADGYAWLECGDTDAGALPGGGGDVDAGQD